jgi:hypothetical protein
LKLYPLFVVVQRIDSDYMIAELRTNPLGYPTSYHVPKNAAGDFDLKVPPSRIEIDGGPPNEVLRFLTRLMNTPQTLDQWPSLTKSSWVTMLPIETHRGSLFAAGDQWFPVQGQPTSI